MISLSAFMTVVEKWGSLQHDTLDSARIKHNIQNAASSAEHRASVEPILREEYLVDVPDDERFHRLMFSSTADHTIGQATTAGTLPFLFTMHQDASWHESSKVLSGLTHRCLKLLAESEGLRGRAQRAFAYKR